MGDDLRHVHPSGPVWPTDQRRFPVPLTIGVISDTHVYANGSRHVPVQVLDLFRRFQCDLIVHCGDVNTGEVLDELAELAPLIAVVGNNDEHDVADLLPEEAWFDVGPHRFVAVHGHGRKGMSARAVARTYADRAACVVYGHSHEPVIEQHDGAILFNPGSATDRRWHPHFGVGLIHVTEDLITPELVLYLNPAHLVNVTP